jgi:type 1 glutamine amidotransferase
MVIRYDAPKKLLLVTKGHPFDHRGFFALFDAMDGFASTHVEHPAAPYLLEPERLGDFDCLVFYDMPGLLFQPGQPPQRVEPPAVMKQGVARLLEQGKPMLFLHHALAGWPAWDLWGQIIGGRFHYSPDPAQGIQDSGYRHDVRHHVQVVADHPVTAGLGGGFDITDELYLVQVDESDKLPLLRSGHQFTRDHFHSADLAVKGRMFCNEGWAHPPGSDLIAWAKRAGNSPVIYIQCGDGPSAYENAAYRRLIGNALGWLTGPESAQWARAFTPAP